MQTKECPSCAVDIEEEEDVCPICGYEFANNKKARQKTILIALFLLIIFVVVYWLLGS